MARERQVGVDLHTASPVDVGAGGAGDQLGDRCGAHARGPHHRPGRDPLGLLADRHCHSAFVDVRDHRVLTHRDAELGELLGHIGRGGRTEPRRDPFAGLEQNHSRGSGVDPPKVSLHGVTGQDRELTRDLDTGRSTAYDHKGKALIAQRDVRGTLGLLEGAEDSLAEIDRIAEGLQPRRDPPPLLVSEVGRLAAAGHDQTVVSQALAAIEYYLAMCDVDIRDGRHQPGRIGLPLEQVANRRGDLAG